MAFRVVYEKKENIPEESLKWTPSQGTWTSTDGRKYVGKFKDGQRNGQGTFTWHDGEEYVGEWKNGKEHGHGTYTWSDGDKYVGEFKEGCEWKGTEYNQEGNIIGKLVNGEPQ